VLIGPLAVAQLPNDEFFPIGPPPVAQLTSEAAKNSDASYWSMSFVSWAHNAILLGVKDVRPAFGI
jgi:hypothetical protein